MSSGGERFRDDALFLPFVIACFTLSGFAALLYQTAWIRQFSLVFGTSELAVATVLAAYMGGLALGAALAARYARRLRRPIFVYGLLEAGIGASAVAVPLLLGGAQALYAAALGGQPGPPDAAAVGQASFYLVVAFAILVLPTTLMGATLPLLAQHAVREDRDIGFRISLLYAMNTVGAALGAVTAGFVLLPMLGLNGTVGMGVAVNGLVFGIAIVLARHVPDLKSLAVEARATAPEAFLEACVRPLLARGTSMRARFRSSFRAQPAWIAPLIFFSGAASFVYEVLWTRLLAHVLGGSIYAFATMLAAFLMGIALGGGLAARVANDRTQAAAVFPWVQVAIAVLSIGIYAWIVPLVPQTFGMYGLVVCAVIVMLPATVFIGATVPLAIRVAARDETEATTSTARIYAWNTVGAIVGAMLGGFVLIPGLGFEGTIRLVVVVNLALALWATSVLATPKLVQVGGIAALLAAALIGWYPARPDAVVSSTAMALNEPSQPREIYYGVGRSATVLLLESSGYYHLRTNGLPEATIAAKGAPTAQEPEKWLTALPVATRPGAEEMLVIGLGGGVALESVPASVRHIDVVELESEVVTANARVTGSRNRDPLEDARVRLILNDARNALELTDKRYDVIASQPSHPWTAGASHLFTREFAASAKRHLKPDGVFVQWMSAEFVDAELLRTLAATLLTEFEHVRLYHPGFGVMMFLASDGSLEAEVELGRISQRHEVEGVSYGAPGLNALEDLFAALALDEAGVTAFAGEAPPSTDDKNLMATRSRSRGDGLTLPELLELIRPYDPLLDREGWLQQRYGAALDYGYMAGRLAWRDEGARAVELAATLSDASVQQEVAGVLYQADGQLDRAAEAFRGAVRSDPENFAARYRLFKLLLVADGGAAAADEIGSVTQPLTGSAAAMIEGWLRGLSGDWQAVARLDPVLARAKLTDAWYPDVARLRAEWRLNAAAQTPQLAHDALPLLEHALGLAPDEDLYMLRLMSALRVGDDDRVLESARYVAASVEATLAAARDGKSVVTKAELARVRGNLEGIADRLRGRLEVRDQGRIGGVLRQVEALLAAMGQDP